MPSMNRRTFLASSSVTIAATSGCTVLGSSGRPAHTVSVYLGDRKKTHDVTVTIKATDGEDLFEKEYQLSDSNEADEDATFPESTEPETIVVTVDETRFEHNWPGPDHPEIPCDGENWTGIEVWIEHDSDGTPTIRLEANCQHVTID